MRRLLPECRRRPLIAKGKGLGLGTSDTVLQQQVEKVESADHEAEFESYSVLIRQCISSKSVTLGRRLHSHMRSHGCHDVFLHNLLVQMYGTCGSVVESAAVFDSIHRKNPYSWNIMLAAYAQNGHLLQARCLFDQMPEKTVVSWTALISAHAQNGHGLQAIHLLKLMDLEGVRADHIAFVSALDACASVRSVELGRMFHSEAAESGLVTNFAVGTAVISMYGKCRRVELARLMFEQMPERNIISWTAMLTTLYQNGELHRALEIYSLMPERNSICATALIAAHAQNGHLLEAEKLFQSMPGRNAISWTTMISAYHDHGVSSKAMGLFNRMETEGIRLDRCTFLSIIEVCASLGDLYECRRIHSKVASSGLEDNITVSNALISMYSKSGGTPHARSVFDRMPQRSLVSWGSLILGYTQNGEIQKAKEVLGRSPEQELSSWNSLLLAEAQGGNMEETWRLFNSMPNRDTASRNALILSLLLNGVEREALLCFRVMDLEGVQPNRVTYSSVLEACSTLSDLEFGRLVETSAVESGMACDVQVGTCLVTMFSRCESFGEAKSAFDRIRGNNVLSWTAMLSSYGQAGELNRARDMFDVVPGRDTAAWNAMITGYAQFGHSTEARELFENMPERNVVSWTAVLASYAESRNPKEAAHLFRLMDLEGQRPNRFTYIKVLEGCAGGVTLGEAKTIHSKVVESGLEDDPPIGIGLLNMYGKCGSVENARRVFDELEEKTVVVWSILIAAYSQAGHPMRSVELFLEMVQAGVLPSEITFVNLLSACSHGGFLYGSWQFFLSMGSDYGLSPFMDHYVCLVDLMGRSGLLRQAEELLRVMPFEPNTVAWTSLLSACKTQGDGKRGACAGEEVMELHPIHSGPYRMVWNVTVTSADDLSYQDHTMCFS